MVKNKKFWIITLSILCFILLCAGCYFLIKKNVAAIKLDRYTDLYESCAQFQQNGELQIICSALLLNIREENNQNVCFDIEILTTSNTAKDMSLCTEKSSLEYTNEILAFKNFMPIQITLNYTQESIFNTYKFEKISLIELPEEYLQNVINKNIEELINMDFNATTTIQNSVNFCPVIDIIQTSVAAENISKYDMFYNQNILKDSDYDDITTYNNETGEINLFLSCLPSLRWKNNSTCQLTNIKYNPETTYTMAAPTFGKTLDAYGIAAISQLTYFYDNSNHIIPTYIPFSATGGNSKDILVEDVINFILEELTIAGKASEEEFCTTYVLLSKLSTSNLDNLLGSMESVIANNIEQSTFPLCSKALNPDLYNKEGLYLHYYFNTKDDILNVLNSCLNLSLYFE